MLDRYLSLRFLQTGVLTKLTLTFSYLETQHDVDVLVRGMRAMFELAKTSHLRAQINQKETDPRFDQDLENLTDEQLEYLIRERSETLYVHSLLDI